MKSYGSLWVHIWDLILNLFRGRSLIMSNTRLLEPDLILIILQHTRLQHLPQGIGLSNHGMILNSIKL